MELDERAQRIYDEEGRPPRTATERFLCRAEEWIYDLNARDHWIFKLYDLVNEVWARLRFRRVRSYAKSYAPVLRGRDDSRAYLRFLTPDDEEAFAELLTRFDFQYTPPHALDADTARRVLRRASYLPFGIFQKNGTLIGYSLVRLFFPKRAATGVWSPPSEISAGMGRAAVQATAKITEVFGIDDYVTVPLDNIASLRGAQWAGWEIVRSNSHFHVLMHEHCRKG